MARKHLPSSMIVECANRRNCCIKWVFYSLMLLSLFLHATDATKRVHCQKGCSCKHGKVMCSKLKSFPNNLPNTTMSLEIRDSNITDIPPGALAFSSNIRHLTIINSKIDKILTCAFSNLKRISITFTGSAIVEIQEGAFRHLVDDVVISLKYTTIFRLHSFAFDDLRNVDALYITHCSFKSISSFAFSKIHSVKKVHIANNNFPILPSLTFINVKNIGLWDMEFNTFSDFACNPFSYLFWNVTEVNVVFNRLPCSCEVAKFLQSDFPFPEHIRDAFIIENMCYEYGKAEDTFLSNLVQEQKNCESLRLASCTENAMNSLEVICQKSSVIRTDKLSSLIPHATVNPDLSTVRDPNGVYADEIEPLYNNPTTKFDSQEKSDSQKKKTETKDDMIPKDGITSGDREASADGINDESKHPDLGSAKRHEPKDEVDVVISRVLKDTSTLPTSRKTERMNKKTSNKADSISGRIGSIVTETPNPKSTKSTSLQLQNQPSKTSGQSALHAYTKFCIISFLLAINCAVPYF
ncbi:uncharacterized protein LOC115215568 isoform X2 [Octopus sinensis]|uniref:Uncharacterized protein LOC115215568 isoform X2 n=1 Tax=Octopus sinensis TaxID=2607531 RepID=A0A6P7SR55_9MOLL|nr:uncharacterized protein LOC115215568 isoform X2 [Octopus sinensis]